MIKRNPALEILYPVDVPKYTHEQWFGMEWPNVPVMCECKADCNCKTRYQFVTCGCKATHGT